MVFSTFLWFVSEVFTSESPEDSGRSFTTFVLTGSLVLEVVAVAGRLTSCIFSALGFGIVEVVTGRSCGRVAPFVAYAVHSAKEKAKPSVSDFKRDIVQEQEHRQSGREEKRQQHRQTIADKRMALQKMQEQSGNHQTHERPATISKENLSENRSKVQEVRRPIRSAGTPIRKEPQKVTVENMEKTCPLSSYEKNSRNKNDVGNVRSTKSQSVQTVQKSQVHKETNRKVVSKKGQKKK